MIYPKITKLSAVKGVGPVMMADIEDVEHNRVLHLTNSDMPQNTAVGKSQHMRNRTAWTIWTTGKMSNFILMACMCITQL